MKIKFLVVLSIVLVSCTSKEQKVKEIINNTNVGIFNVKKMSEIEKLKEDIYSLPVHYSIVQKYADIKENNEFEITRYIYKTSEGANRMFYLIDLTDKKVIDRSNNFNTFYEPIAKEILGNSINIDLIDLEGNNLMELMRY